MKHPLETIYQAVLVRVIRDLVGAGVTSHPFRVEAERWVGLFPSTDFRVVCDHARIDSDRAHRVLRAMCAMEIKERTEAFERVRQVLSGENDAGHVQDRRRVMAA